MDLTELKRIIAEQGDSFAAWRKEQTDKVAELKSQFDEFVLRSQRPGFAGTHAAEGYTEALGQAMRKAALGDDREIKAMSAGSDPDGGYLVVPQMDSIIRQIRDIVSPLSGLVRNVDLTSGAELLMPYQRGTLPSAWVGETSARPETDTLAAGQHRIALHEVYVCPSVTQKLLDTANYDVGRILVDQIAHGLATAEAAALHSGDGVARPRGFVTMPTAATADDARDFGVIQHIPTGASGGFHTTKADPLLDTVAALKPQYRPNAKWLMARSTAAKLWKLKEATSDRYLWEPGLHAGQPDRLFGYPVVIDDNVPAIEADALAMWFGDWQQAYTTVRMRGLRLLRDPYTSKGSVFFYCYQRIGGLLTNSEAVKAVKFGTA